MKKKNKKVWLGEESEKIKEPFTSSTMTAPSDTGSKCTVEPLAPGNYDRAWNDPPLFSYSDSSSVQLSRPKTSLNKRVGFPTSQPPPLSNQSASHLPPKLHDAGARPALSSLPPPPPGMSSLPPPPPGPSVCIGPPPPLVPSCESREVSQDHDIVLEKLHGLVDRNFDDMTKQVAHKKRLAAMSSAWKEGRLTARLIGLVSDLSSSLEHDDWEAAEKWLTTMSADYGGECSAWIISVRHLVNAVKEKHKGDVVKPEVITAPL